MKSRPDITLIFPPSPFLLDQKVFPPLGILYLSAFLKERMGWEVQCLDMGIGHTLDMVESDLIGVSMTTPQRNEAFAIVEHFKDKGKSLIAGGAHATHFSEECYDNGFDMVATGYGEVFFQGKKFKIDDFPFPDRDALPIHAYHYEIDGKPATPIMTSRGCPNACSFCGKIDSTFKMQSPERTVAEIHHIHDKYGFEAFMIYDDLFIASKNRMAGILELLKRPFTFRCFARSNLVEEGICQLLADLGVVEVGLGIETGSDAILKKNMKGATVEQNSRAVALLRKYGIRAKSFIIVGLPGETHETVEETADWLRKTRPDDVDVSVFQPYPGSPIFENPEEWGITFQYDGKPQWFKGTPGKYESSVSTESLSAQEIVKYRDMLEAEFKPKELLR